MSFGSRLQLVRTQHNMTQKELAEKINLSRANISKYEADSIEPNFGTVLRIAALFNVSVDYLLGANDNPEPAGTPIPKHIKTLIPFLCTLSEEELKKAVEYIAFLKTKRNSGGNL